MNLKDKKLTAFAFVTLVGLFTAISSSAVAVPLRAATPQQSYDRVDAAGKAGIDLDQKQPVPTLSEQGLTELLTTAASRRRTAARLVAQLERQTRCLAPQDGYPIPFALDVINVVIKTMFRVDSQFQDGQSNKQDITSSVDEQESAHSTYFKTTYWENVDRDLPFDWNTSFSDVAVVRYHQHVANAAACAEKVLECQRRATAAIGQGDGEMAVVHLETGLYLSWRGRHELREARKHWNLAISQLGDWFERFEAQTSDGDLALEQRFAAWQVETRRDGLAGEHVAALRKAGCLPHEIDQHKVRLLSYDVRETARLYSKFRSLLPASKEIDLGKPPSDHNSLQDRIWTRLCYIWASLLKKYEQTEIAFELQELRGGADEQYSGWCVLPAGAPASELLRRSVMPTPKARSLLSVVTNKENDAEARSGPLVPAHYDVYLIIKKPERKQPLPVAVRVAKDVEVRLGQTAKVSVFDSQVRTLERLSFNSGVRIETSDGQSLPHKWFLVHHGADWTTTVGQSYEDAKDRMLVAPGKYDVYLAESNRPPLPFARAVTVKKNHWTVIEIGSALRLEVAKFLPSVNHHYGRWGVVRAGGNPNDMLHWSKSPGTLVLPPGEYDIYLKQDYWHKPLLLSANISVERGKLAKVRIDSGVKLEVAEGVPEFGYNGYWGVVPAGARFSTLLHWSKSPGALVLPLGTYDVYWKQSSSHKPLLLAADVRVDRGKISTVRVDSGVKLEVAEGVPEFGYNGYWGVVPAGARPSPLLHWSKSPGALVLPLGTYDVYWKQSSSHKPLLLAADVRVDRGKISTVRVDSGVKLEVAEGVPEFGYNGYWGVVPAGARPSPLLHWSKSPGALVLPLGTYDVYWKQSSSHKPLLLAADVRVDRGKISTVRVDSGVKLEVAEGVPEFGYNGYWGVVPAGARPSPLLHWSKSPGALVLPLGTYDVYWKQSSSHKPLLLAADVRVDRGKISTVRVDSGVKLEVAEGVPEFGYNGYWGVVPAGARPSPLLHWSKSPGALVLPLGTYDVYWKQSSSHKPLLLAADVRVDRGKISTVRIDSGVKLEVAEGVPEFGYNGYWGVVPAGARPSPLLHWSKSPGTLVLPLGTYDVYWKQSHSHKARLVESGVELERRTVKTIRVDDGP